MIVLFFMNDSLQFRGGSFKIRTVLLSRESAASVLSVFVFILDLLPKIMTAPWPHA